MSDASTAAVSRLRSRIATVLAALAIAASLGTVTALPAEAAACDIGYSITDSYISAWVDVTGCDRQARATVRCGAKMKTTGWVTTKASVTVRCSPTDTPRYAWHSFR
ncbi:hypothetical protein CDO52_24570 [Nocardiopsis gilva YIM 90087]|uniref:Secreted protein n=2 Tax=Nocardiopsis gilva TaxID=280236 RepID=A0A223SBS4_9ACTN|nr:hypothetical protein [Nocardiopsis gilva]ASU85552.1 hypothetical protein CDO52_24570 [Nocardiopsis gilva YIM 90087]